jgi:3-methyladenine DNA glycosylase AlkD
MSLLLDLRRALERAADPARAPAMQAYMKSTMPYHGVPTPVLRGICKTVFAEVRFATTSQWQKQVLSLWRNARFREERYAAINLTGEKSASAFQTPAAMKMYEKLIVSGAGSRR